MANRDRIDEVRRALVDAFLAGEETEYVAAVSELEKLIGVEPGRIHRDTMKNVSQEQRALRGRHMQSFRWGKKSLDAEVVDGVLSWTVKHG